jgi:hypothetical protein
VVFNILLAGFNLKNDGVKVRWDDDIPNWMEKKSKCSKPPPRIYITHHKSFGESVVFTSQTNHIFPFWVAAIQNLSSQVA